MSRRLLVVSDTHLGHRAPTSIQQWDAVVRLVAHDRPDLVVHAGDLSLDGAHQWSDLAEARRQIDRLDAPWHVVPGNHDIGDNPVVGASPGASVDQARLDEWRRTIGWDWWSTRVGEVRVVGVNAQLFGSGLPDERAQWRWLVDELTGECRRQRTVLVSHKPIVAPSAERAGAPWYRYAPSEVADRLLALLGPSVELVVSGHVHQYRQLAVGGRRHVWAPSTWAVLPDRAQDAVGTKVCGVVAVDLHDDDAEVSHLEPSGTRRLTIGDDLPDPYRG